MINPPQVRPEEPTAVTPHGGICGGESQQWLSYPTRAIEAPRPAGVVRRGDESLGRSRLVESAADERAGLESAGGGPRPAEIPLEVQRKLGLAPAGNSGEAV